MKKKRERERKVANPNKQAHYSFCVVKSHIRHDTRVKALSVYCHRPDFSTL